MLPQGRCTTLQNNEAQHLYAVIGTWFTKAAKVRVHLPEWFATKNGVTGL